MYSGGISDKLGNQYERLWAVKEFMRVLKGTCVAITYEGLDESFTGFEYCVESSDHTEWVQSKINAPSGNWTIGALKTKGILSAFIKKLSDPNTMCSLVSQDGSKMLREAANDARLSKTLEGYMGAISKDRKTVLEAFRSPEDQEDVELKAFDRLTRCHFKTMPTNDVKEFVDVLASTLFRDPQSATELISEYLEENLNRRITTEVAREWVREHPHLDLKAGLDHTAFEKIGAANHRYLNSYSQFHVHGAVIERSEVADIMAQLDAGDDIILLTGGAGSGKSGVVHQLIEQLNAENTCTLALRVDHLLEKSTAAEFGAAIGVDESPALMVSGVANDEHGVLIVDQIDAVSEVSGRSGATKDAVLTLLREARILGNVRCIIVCRQHDLEGDPQFRELEKRERASTILVSPLDWETQVFPLLEDIGASNVFTEQQKKLLCLPINLTIFLEVGDGSFSPSTTNELYEKLIEQKQRKNRGKQIIEPLRAMANRMSERQLLTSTNTVLDNYPDAEDLLLSEGLILRDGRQLAFFHESLFDYLFARAFLDGEQSIMQMLLSAEQNLFRRTQVRQILQEARDVDRGWYLRNLREILQSGNIRTHIKHAVALWLSQITDPTMDELEVILNGQDLSGDLPMFLRQSLLTTSHWITLLDQRGLIERGLISENKKTQWHVRWWFARNAGSHPQIAARIMREWWEAHPDLTHDLVDWFGYVDRKNENSELVDLLVEALNTHPKNLFVENGKDVMRMVFHAWVRKGELGADRILKAAMETWFAEHPQQHLFSYRGEKDLEMYNLQDLIKVSPELFLRGMIPALNHTLDTIENSADVSLAHSFDMQLDWDQDNLLSLYFDAFKRLAESSPVEAANLLEEFAPERNKMIARLWLETIEVAPEALGKLFDRLLYLDRIQHCGAADADFLPFAKAISALSRVGGISPDEIESVIFSNFREHEDAKREIKRSKEGGEDAQLHTEWARECMKNSGLTQWNILQIVGRENLTEAGQTRFGILERKFGLFEEPVPRLNRVRAVVSPLKKDVVEKMSDEHWLRAIQKYDNEQWRGREDERTISGGSSELAVLLHNEAKNDPNRFARLFLLIPEGASHIYRKRCVDGIAYSENPDATLLSEILHSFSVGDLETLGIQFCNIVEQHPSVASNDDVFNQCLSFAENGTGDLSDSELNQSKDDHAKIDDLIHRNTSILLNYGSNTRAAAWAALAKVLWHDPDRTAEIWPVMERRLRDEPSPIIRGVMLRTLVPIFNIDKQKFENGMIQLLQRQEGQELGHDLFPLATYYGADIMGLIGSEFPDSAHVLMERMINSDNRVLELVGAWWFFRHAINDQGSTEWFPDLQSKTVEHLQIWVKTLAQTASDTEFRHFAMDNLTPHFSDENESIRKAASSVFRNIDVEEFDHFRQMAHEYIASPALLDGGFGFLNLLGDVTTDVSELVICAGEAIMQGINASDDSTGSRGDDLHQLKDLLKREYQNSEHRPEIRARILDLIDLQVEGGHYGVDTLLELAER